MQNTSSTNVHNGKLPLWTFIVFSITFLIAVLCTWLITWKTCSYSNQQVYNILEKSLQTSQLFIESGIRDIDHELQKKQQDPATKEKTDFWKPILDTAVSAMNRLNEHIDILKQKVQQGGNLEANERRQLLDSVRLFNAAINSVIPKDKRESLGKLPIQLLFDSTSKTDNWSELFLEENNSNKLLSLLTKLQFESSISTYISSDFCNQQTHYIDEGYDVFDILIGQNAQLLLPNKTLKITAGVGTYSSSTKPEIIIDGVKQDLNPNGFVVFEKKVKANGYVPVSITFKDPTTGQMKTISKNITYTVFQPPKN